MSDIEAFKSSLADWKHRLSSGRDIHSIGAQVAPMPWRSAFYRSLNESRRFLPDDEGESGRKRANEPLHELLDDGYFIVNSTAIRRLLDKAPISGPLGVYSLYGLICDIKENAKLVTRTNVLAARDLPCDFEPVKRRAHENARREAGAKGNHVTFVSGEGWKEAEYWHRVMDQLCGVREDNRRAGDMPDQNKLQRLLDALDECGRSVRRWVDKFVAHAASPESRQTLDPDHQSLSLGELWRAERVILRAANFISYYFVNGTNLGGVPIPQFDQFIHLDQPFISPSALPAMHQAWDRHCEETSSCTKWFWDSPLTDASDVWKDLDG